MRDRPQHVAYTRADRQRRSKKLLNDQVPILEASPSGSRCVVWLGPTTTPGSCSERQPDRRARVERIRRSWPGAGPRAC